MKKIDIHIHTTLKREVTEGPFPMTPAKEMMDYLSEKGIVHGMVMCMGESAKPGNEECAEICKAEPRLHWNCNFDPVSPETVMDRMALYKEMGAVGVGELAINERMDKPMIQAIFSAAEKMEMPVLFHMSPEEGFNYGIVDDPGLPLLEEALKKYPHLKLIGHSQPFWMEISGDTPTDNEGRNGRGEGRVVPGGRIVELLEKYPNLYADLSAGSGFCAIVRDEEYGLSFLEKFCDQLMFGTDTVSSEAPWQVPLWQWLEEKAAEGKISETTMKKICYENAERVYGISLRDREDVILTDTPCGQIRGIKGEKKNAYLGIPYASAERFRYPVLTEKWEGILDATEYGNCSWQFRAFQSEALGADPFYYDEFRKDIVFHYGDDCQRLNIWTPCENPEKPYPVIVYIHGGAFLGGSAGEKHLAAPKWPEKGVVAVTINYRLGPFGFLCSTDGIKEAGHAGNYGLYDQIAALQWVKNNITAFGGDPDNITLMGQSAGCMCVQLLSASPLTEDLIKRACMFSGAGLTPVFDGKETDRDNAAFGDAVIKTAGCNSLEELRKVSAWKILGAFGAELAHSKTGLGVTSPVIDGIAVLGSVSQSIEKNAYHKIPYMMCSTSEDLWQPELFHAILKWQDAVTESGNVDCYAAHLNRQLPGDDHGAFHSSDLWYWCDTLDQSWRPFDAHDRRIAECMSGYLTNFARTGDPNGEELPLWHRHVDAKGTVMVFGQSEIGEMVLDLKGEEK